MTELAGGRRPRSLAAGAFLPLFVLLPALASCTGGSAREGRAGAEPPSLLIFVYDRSTSILDHQLELARKLTDRRLESLEHGDRVAAMEVLQRSLAEEPRRWTQKAPERRWKGRRVREDSLNRVRFVRDVKAYVQRFSDTAGRENIDGTDLLSTLHDVAAEVRAHPGYRARVYLFSDMLQAGADINMEGLRRMPPDGWVSKAASGGRLPDLGGACMVVVGARTDTDAGQRVKRFWDRYFEAVGAVLEDRNYMYRPVRLPEDPCPGTS